MLELEEAQGGDGGGEGAVLDGALELGQGGLDGDAGQEGGAELFVERGPEPVELLLLAAGLPCA